MVFARVCKLCGESFEVERKVGRPRLHCYECVPAGWKAVKLPYRVKLRRVIPLGPRIPKGGFASVSRLPL
jgi:hypothetical protein